MTHIPSHIPSHIPPHISENDLILYEVHESPVATSIRAHLAGCPACAELATSIAETLRVFSAEPVPQPDLDQAWQRLRPHLPVLAQAFPSRSRMQRPRWPVLAPVVSFALAALLLLIAHLPRPHAQPQPTSVANIAPGPLTPHPVDPAVSAHLDSAERFLTEVSHISEPLDPAMREQAQTLLAHNALYIETARNSGDLAGAAVLEKLDRVLTTADHEPGRAADSEASGWHVRLEVNADGLLLDLRILRQNRTQRSASQTQPPSTQGNRP